MKQKTTIWMSNTGNDKGHLQHLTDHLRSNEIPHSTEYSEDNSVELSLRKLSAHPKAVYQKYNKAFQGVRYEVVTLGLESLQSFLGEQFESVLQLNPIESETPSASQSEASSASSASTRRSLRLRGQRNNSAGSSGSIGKAASSSTGKDDVFAVPAGLDKTLLEEKHTNNKRASEIEISNFRDDPVLTESRRKRARKSQN
ncbi:uncharacterized protein EAF02_001664 [Botrytis sinoallii]|uniref:uncharacterized protein n=1 Tax=Botrytis sinoallii TaxID=1463999 RepID=UPI0019003EA5|nr:uncharacterized protein EAF02_001664 [Botrytis sinoallii]KAF7891339.1 hypothetical protein EAF02_001664 [Botrytis sinoallii]